MPCTRSQQRRRLVSRARPGRHGTWSKRKKLWCRCPRADTDTRRSGPSTCHRMDATALFQPPQPTKDGLDVQYLHGIAPQSYLTPFTAPLDPSAVSHAAWTDQRRRHMRRVYDLLHLQLLRGDAERALRCLQILLASPEWKPVELWKMGLWVATLSEQEDEALQYLHRLSRTRSTLRPYAFPLLIREMIAQGHYEQAHESLSSMISAYPYRHYPHLHTYMGLLTLYLNTDEASHEDSVPTGDPWVPSRVLAATSASAVSLAQHHFENAVKVAPRYTNWQSRLAQQRVQIHHARQEKLRKNAVRYRTTMWARLKLQGRVFRGPDIDSLSDKRTTADSTSSASSEEYETGAPSSPGVQHEASLPETDFFGLDMNFDSDAESDASPLSPSTAGLSEGPSLPPSVSASRHGTPSSSTSEEEDAPPLPSPAPTMPHTLLYVTWAVHVAKAYLAMVRIFFDAGPVGTRHCVVWAAALV